MTMDAPEDESIPISALNHFAYCPRRCYLIHAEREFEENVHTLRGRFEHERVDQGRHEVDAEVRVEYALTVWDHRLGLGGKCDAVELRPDGTAYPVEYKHGKRRRWSNDDLQLAAQALCLEATLGRPVEKGAIYHQQSRRRREVAIDEALRREVESTTAQVREMLRSARLPPPVADERRCPECSLRSVCQPDLARSEARLEQARALLFEPEEA